MEVKRGQVYYATLDHQCGSVQGGYRPVIIIQNDKGNAYSSTVVVALCTSVLKKEGQPTHVIIMNGSVFKKATMVLAEQILTIDKRRLLYYVGELSEEHMQRVDEALCVSLGLTMV